MYINQGAEKRSIELLRFRSDTSSGPLAADALSRNVWELQLKYSPEKIRRDEFVCTY